MSDSPLSTFDQGTVHEWQTIQFYHLYYSSGHQRNFPIFRPASRPQINHAIRLARRSDFICHLWDNIHSQWATPATSNSIAARFPGVHLTYTRMIRTMQRVGVQPTVTLQEETFVRDFSEFQLTILHFHLPSMQDRQYEIIDWHNQPVWTDEIMYGTSHYVRTCHIYL